MRFFVLIVLIAMLFDKDENIRQLAVNKVQSLRDNTLSVSFIVHSKESGVDANPDEQLSIRKLVLSEVNHKAKTYYELECQSKEEPRVVRGSMTQCLKTFAAIL